MTGAARCWLGMLVVAALPALAQPVRLAAPGFNAVNFDEAIAAFYSEHFAQQLALRNLSVVTAAEISTLVGLERQKQLLGCGDDASSCLAELSNALGVDGIITGSIGRLGKTLQANIKIIRAADGRALSLVSRTASSEDALFDALTEAAEVAAHDVISRLRPGQQTALDAARAGLGPIAYRVYRANLLRVDLFGALVGAYAVEYERVLVPLVSVAVRPAAIVYHFGDLTRGGELGLAGRFYPGARAPHGFWLGPEVRGGYSRRSASSGFAFAVSGATGWSWVSETLPVAASVALVVGPYLTAHYPNSILPMDLRFSGNVGLAF